ncbi:hypothetical protein BDP81DRAFT_414476 [Colletotrichum phormii]|uniref:Uncharacterized protein n=1 Tax=Colletotrichum phormii TaxID=359342 RepID=A0AAJ0A4C4_9PEZI|nr:uncharacterized protein BDP81DRAFT_414476 [Colletotrichum phormii]KAK1656256.1 hypothetical protein BDP81DRAFT_414476 [Colletotrichum phormii]
MHDLLLLPVSVTLSLFGRHRGIQARFSQPSPRAETTHGTHSSQFQTAAGKSKLTAWQDPVQAEAPQMKHVPSYLNGYCNPDHCLPSYVAAKLRVKTEESPTTCLTDTLRLKRRWIPSRGERFVRRDDRKKG